MGVVSVPPAADVVTTVVESATIPGVAYAVPPPTAHAALPTSFPIATAGAGALTTTVQAYHPSIHCCPLAISTMSMISVRASKVTVAQRAPLHITAVVDTSGSMNSDNKLNAVKAALRFVMASLSDEDTFSVVSFDETARVIVSPTPVTHQTTARVTQQICAMTAQGRTNLSAGIQMASGLMAPSRPTLIASCPPPVYATRSSVVARVAPPPVPAHLAAVKEVVSTPPPIVAVPPFYVGVTRHTATDSAALLSIEATLPPYVSHIDVSAAGQIGTLQWKNGSPAMAVWPKGALTFSIVFSRPNFASVAQTVELESGVATFLTIAPQMTAVAPAPTVTTRPPPRPVAVVPKKPVQLMMVFTDGEANLGISDVNTLSRKAAEWLHVTCPDATLVAFGFGASHNAKLLRQLATSTQGTYYHVPTAADIPKLFGDCLGGFMSIAARKIVVTVQPASPFVTLNDIQTTYRSTRDAHGTIKVFLKDLFAEERRDMVVSVTVHPSILQFAEALPLFNVTVTSCDALGNPADTLTTTSTIPVVATPYTGLPNTDIDEQIGRMAAATAVEKAADLASAGRFEEARTVVLAARGKQVKSRSAYAMCVDEDLAQVERHLNATAWVSKGCVAANSMQSEHAQQRCNRPCAPSAAYYQTAAKASFGMKAVAFAGGVA